MVYERCAFLATARSTNGVERFISRKVQGASRSANLWFVTKAATLAVPLQAASLETRAPWRAAYAGGGGGVGVSGSDAPFANRCPSCAYSSSSPAPESTPPAHVIFKVLKISAPR